MKNTRNLLTRSTAGTLALLILHAAPSWAQSDSSKTSLEDLDQKIRILERKLEVADEVAAAKTPIPLVTADGDGFTIKSADGNFVLRSRGLLQADYRSFLGDTNYNDVRKYKADSAYDADVNFKHFPKLVNTFLLRKVRPIWDVTLWKNYNFRITPDFGGGTTVLMDAYGEANFLPELKLRVGKFTPPLALERIQSSSDNNFVEYNFPAALAPSRDIGVQLYGDLFGESVIYTVGIFNGAVDGANQDVENTQDKDLAGRIFVQPFKILGSNLLSGLGVGVAGTWGKQFGDSATPNLASYKTPGQNTFFKYSSKSKDDSTLRAWGDHYRINPQATWYAGPFSLSGEYIASSQDVATRKPVRDTVTHTYQVRNLTTLTNTAWGASASWVITGEPTSFKSVKPRHALGPGSGIGAIELVVRAGQFTPDEQSFTGNFFADTLSSARKATSYGGGVNWYFNRAVKWVIDYELTTFEQGAKDVAGKVKDRDDEQVVTTRLQLNF